ncbi:YjbF family lipoprotein [Aliiglaciecola lipolytica]|uniref:Lipoprotein n=1 Tax=Aliiglaciecola lipolytica E3 TaxID=1127673 RepID=K6X490_9ALTE|nr:YjbF family lipoprotein [Aliiglaciecola lipolytica]GAC15439.1 hypothetical protein GLIP_2818 [Aliiglaciecola lipolytica E3]
MKIIFSLMICSTIFISACSSTQRAYQQNVKLYFSTKNDIELSQKDVVESPIDLIYIKSGERPYATMALGFIENNQYKWVSADDAMLVTQNGRLVRTLGLLGKNLVHVNDLTDDPLISKSDVDVSATWYREIDLNNDHYGIKLTSSFSVEKNVPLNILNQQFVSSKVIENVKSEGLLSRSDTWQNLFWYHAETGQLLRSSQQFSVDSERYEIQYVSRAMRLVGDSNE